ncbi:hypothetical protein WKI68_21305 [Streptomyces sp. MS1.HAVA.3]|uniref:Uncharacterized protein n=1 Tax=Streptomyces caledonius TaxID=3134107 RepID=A0ABU8U5W6_9ACTN
MGHRDSRRGRGSPAVGSEAAPFAAPPEAPAESDCGGFAPASGFFAVQASPDGTHAKRTSYDVFGVRTREGAAADGSGSSPVAASPALWPTTATAEPVPTWVAAEAATVSWPVTAQPCAETLVTRKLPYTRPSASGALDQPTTSSWSAPHPGTPLGGAGGSGPEPPPSRGSCRRCRCPRGPP